MAPVPARRRSLGAEDAARHERLHDLSRRLGRPAAARLPGRLDASATSSGDRRPPCLAQGAGRLDAAWRRRREQGAAPGTVEAWGRSADNPVGGWYGLRKGYRGRFGIYVPPLLEALGLAEVEHNPRNNRMRAI